MHPLVSKSIQPFFFKHLPSIILYIYIQLYYTFIVLHLCSLDLFYFATEEFLSHPLSV